MLAPALPRFCIKLITSKLKSFRAMDSSTINFSPSEVVLSQTLSSYVSYRWFQKEWSNLPFPMPVQPVSTLPCHKPDRRAKSDPKDTGLKLENFGN